MSAYLMSIKPRWARELYRGEKTVEFRKSSPPVGSFVFLYESAPVSAVTGVFSVEAVLSASALHVWYATRTLKQIWKPGSVTKNMLSDYCGGDGGQCCAILAVPPIVFPETEWVRLEKFAVRPPQSWQRLRANNLAEYALAQSLYDVLKRVIEGGDKWK